jgi:hypothetical protein
VRVAAAPHGGNCTVTPKAGVALSTRFQLDCSGWRPQAAVTDMGPLTYSFQAFRADGASVFLGGPQNATGLQVSLACNGT